MKLNYLLKLITSNTIFFEFLKFGLVGVVSTITHYAIYYVMLRSVNTSIAFSIGYGLSLILNFILTTYFTFGVKPTALKGMGFTISHLINYLLQLSFLNLFLIWGMTKQLAPIPVFTVCIPINFLLVRFFVKKFTLAPKKESYES